MNRLNLAPLPVFREDSSISGTRQQQEGGFVEDEVVLQMIAAPVYHRTVPLNHEFVFSRDDDDFAGWHYVRVSPFRLAKEASAHGNPHTVGDFRNLEPRSHPKPGQIPVTTYSGQHRWWMAGTLGIMFIVLFSYLFTIPNDDRPSSPSTTQLNSQALHGAQVVQAETATASLFP